MLTMCDLTLEKYTAYYGTETQLVQGYNVQISCENNNNNNTIDPLTSPARLLDN